MKKLVEYLEERKTDKNIQLFFDIETLQYNELEGSMKPSKYKNVTFSVAVSWLEGSEVELEIFPNFKEFFNAIISVYGTRKKTPTIHLNAHNTNKYDNHFLRHDLLYFFPDMTFENYYLTTATTDDSNDESLRLKDITKEQKEKGIILEKRVKSSINLEMIFFLKGIQFHTVDNWVKTNSSIAMLGKKLLRLGVIEEKHLKTSFDYTKHNVQEDMSDEQAYNYALQVFNSLDKDEITYIENDVILLAKSVYYYSKLFNGFDYSKMTFTSNILESYNTNNLTSFQLLNRVGEGKEKREIRYTDYQFANQNFYDYLKPFYRGGLNFYNQHFVGKILKNAFSIDINSSYPFAMHKFKIPTYIKDYEEFQKETIIDVVLDDNIYTLYQMSKESFDRLILDRIDSLIIRQMLVKYYSTNQFININSYTFRMIEKVTGVRIEKIPVFSYVNFETQYFGSREQISKYYEIKTRGSQKNKIIYNSPYDIYVTDEVNTELYTREEIDNSKVNLNGLYGIPALRPYFNLFRYSKKKGEYINVENGHKNAERNIVFSIFVTSVSVWNLLSPLGNLSQEEIDENFIYCDTDSLYLKNEVRHKIPTSIYSDTELGKWGIDNEHIEKIYIMNHKKYAYQVEGKIKVKSGGIPHSSFNTDMTFEKFIETQFSNGSELEVLKSIYNDQQTISIYPSKTVLEVGGGYRVRTNSQVYDTMKEIMLKQIKEQGVTGESDVLYIESTIGTFSLSELFPLTHEVKMKEPLVFLEMEQEEMRKMIEQE